MFELELAARALVFATLVFRSAALPDVVVRRRLCITLKLRDKLVETFSKVTVRKWILVVCSK